MRSDKDLDVQAPGDGHPSCGGEVSHEADSYPPTALGLYDPFVYWVE